MPKAQSPHHPIVSPEEIEGFLRRLPVALDRRRFTELALGFPRAYLEHTPATEVVRHFALMTSLGERSVISSLARDGERWRICVVARDRAQLFARIAGSLSCHGLDVVSAEAFANANALVLDTFCCVDRLGHLERIEDRRAFQVFLEGVVEGRTLLPRRQIDAVGPADSAWRAEVELQDVDYPPSTRLAVSAPDRIGLLYLLGEALSGAGCNIEAAYVATPSGTACDTFFLTQSGTGGPLSAAAKRDLLCAIDALGHAGEAAAARASQRVENAPPVV